MPRTRLPSEFLASVYALVRPIPSGQVMTYGQIAGLVLPPPGVEMNRYERVKPRWVGYAMASCPEDVPWHRVVNARGRISLREGEAAEVQRLLLAEEGVVFEEGGQLDLARYRWDPGAAWPASHPHQPPPENSQVLPGSSGGLP